MKTTEPVILGLDLANRSGFAVVDFNENLIWWSAVDLKKRSKSATESLGGFLGSWLVHQYNIQAFSVEEAFGFAKAAAIRNRLTGVCEEVSRQLGTPFYFCHVGKVKKFATGNGKATKEDMIAAVKAKYPQFDGDDNAADAVMIALYTLEQLRS